MFLSSKLSVKYSSSKPTVSLLPTIWLRSSFLTRSTRLWLTVLWKPFTFSRKEDRVLPFTSALGTLMRLKRLLAVLARLVGSLAGRMT